LELVGGALKLASPRGVLADFEFATGCRLFGSQPWLDSALLLVDRMLAVRDAPRGRWCVSVIWKLSLLALF